MQVIDELAKGTVSPATADLLLRGELRRRKLLIHAVVAELKSDRYAPGLGTRAEAALAVLGRVEASCPAVVRGLLAHPFTGVWVGHVLRRLHRPEAHSDSTCIAPLAVEVDHLQALAGAALVRGGVPGSVELHVEDGGVVLPTLGRVQWPSDVGTGTGTGPDEPDPPAMVVVDDAGRVEVCWRGAAIAVPRDVGEAGPGWTPLPVGFTGRPGPIVLDVFDAYRDLSHEGHDAHPEPVGPDEAATWSELLREAMSILDARHEEARALVARTIRAVAPLAAPSLDMSASHNEGFGACQLSLPTSGTALAETLIHEARHSILNGLIHLVPLTRRPVAGVDGPFFYAPWRTDPRPATALLHGIFSFAGNADFWRVERRVTEAGKAALADFAFAVSRDAVGIAVRQLDGSDALTAWGRRFLDVIGDHIAHWQAEQVLPVAQALAHQHADDSLASWRMRCLQPDESLVIALAEDYRCGRDPRPVAGYRPSLIDGQVPQLLGGRGALRWRWIEDPSTVLAHDEVPGADRDPSPIVGPDTALVSGEMDLAAAGYLAVLAERPEIGAAWTGLGLALDRDSPDPSVRSARRTLLTLPELVRRIHAKVHSGGCAPPMEVAAWLDGWQASWGDMPLESGSGLGRHDHFPHDSSGRAPSDRNRRM